MMRNLKFFLMQISFNFGKFSRAILSFFYCEIVYFKEYFISGFWEVVPQHLFGRQNLQKVNITLTASVTYQWPDVMLFFIYMGKTSGIKQVEDSYWNCASMVGHCTLQMQPCGIQKYLQILRFQSLTYVLLTSQEEAGWAKEGCLGTERDSTPV